MKMANKGANTEMENKGFNQNVTSVENQAQPSLVCEHTF